MSLSDDIDRLTEYLNSDEERLGELSPPGYAMTRFITPTFPSSPFMVTSSDGEMDDTGPYVADDWDQDIDTGAMFCNPRDGAPQYLRVLSQDNNDIVAVDSMGNDNSFTFTALPDNTIPTEDPPLNESQLQAMRNQPGVVS